MLALLCESMLGYGTVAESKDGNWSFRIRDRAVLNRVLFPMIDKFWKLFRLILGIKLK